MHKGRLEAFSDGVFAIIITIMVLEIKVPHGIEFSDLKSLLPIFLSYVLSFIYVGIYWNNHHHMLYTTKKVQGTVMWANLYLLFWLSLVPFATAWIGENHFAPLPMATYGFILLMNAMAWWILQTCIVRIEGEHSLIAKVFSGKRIKEKISPVIYVLGIVAAFINPWISGAMYVLVAFMWLIPDLRVEHTLKRENEKD